MFCIFRGANGCGLESQWSWTHFSGFVHYTHITGITLNTFELPIAALANLTVRQSLSQVVRFCFKVATKTRLEIL